jgi:uncharacterized protein (TIGR02466 family)
MGARANAALFADSHPIRMFPTLVWRAELTADARAGINASILKALTDLRRSLRPLQLGEGWQSRHDLQNRESLAELVACVRAATIEVLGFLKIGHEDVAVTGCWMNVLAPGGAHRAHSHPNNFLSGVYYVTTPAGADTVNFHDPRPQTRIIRPPVTELTADNTDQVVVKVKDGTLLLFPAWLEHSVDENRGAQERISVSFNVMFAGYCKSMGAPMW